MVSKPRIYYTCSELTDFADRLGFKLKMTSKRMLLLESNEDPDCWGTVTDLSKGIPAVGCRYYTREGWNTALPDNIEHIKKMASASK